MPEKGEQLNADIDTFDTFEFDANALRPATLKQAKLQENGARLVDLLELTDNLPLKPAEATLKAPRLPYDKE